MTVKDCITADKRVVLRSIRTGDFLEPSISQLKSVLHQWTPGSVERGKYVFIDVDELP